MTASQDRNIPRADHLVDFLMRDMNRDETLKRLNDTYGVQVGGTPADVQAVVDHGAVREEAATKIREFSGEVLGDAIARSAERKAAREAEALGEEVDVDHLAPQVDFVKASFGAGKSYEMMQSLSRVLPGTSATAVIVAPTHTLANQIAEDIRQIDALKNVRIEFRRGKLHDGCQREEEVKAIQESDLRSSTNLLCRGQDDDGNDVFCPHAATCPAFAQAGIMSLVEPDDVYPPALIEAQPEAEQSRNAYEERLAQVRTEPTVVITVHHYLDPSIPPSKLIKDADVVVIDESILTTLVSAHELEVEIFRDQKISKFGKPMPKKRAWSSRFDLALATASHFSRVEELMPIAESRTISARLIDDAIAALGEGSAAEVVDKVCDLIEADKTGCFALRSLEVIRQETADAVREKADLERRAAAIKRQDEETGRDKPSRERKELTAQLRKLKPVVARLERELRVTEIISKHENTPLQSPTREAVRADRIRNLRRAYQFQVHIIEAEKAYAAVFDQAVHRINPLKFDMNLVQQSNPVGLGTEMILTDILAAALKQMYPVLEDEGFEDVNWLRMLKVDIARRTHDIPPVSGARTTLRREFVGPPEDRKLKIVFGRLKPLAFDFADLLILDGSADLELYSILLNTTHARGREPLVIDLPMSARFLYSRYNVTKTKLEKPADLEARFRTLCQAYEFMTEVVRGIDNDERTNDVGVVTLKLLADYARGRLRPGQEEVEKYKQYFSEDTLRDLIARQIAEKAIMHMGNVKGRNEMASFKGMILVGKMEPPVHTIRSIADAFEAAATPTQKRAIGRRKSGEDLQRMFNDPKTFGMRTGQTLTVESPGYKDPWMHRVHVQYRNEELAQSVGRIRPTRERSMNIDDWPVVMILSNVIPQIFGIVIDAVMNTADIAKYAGVWKASLATGGFTATTLVDGNYIAGLSGNETTTKAAVSRDLKRLGFHADDAGVGYAVFSVRQGGKQGASYRVFLRTNVVDWRQAAIDTVVMDGADANAEFVIEAVCERAIAMVEAPAPVAAEIVTDDVLSAYLPVEEVVEIEEDAIIVELPEIREKSPYATVPDVRERARGTFDRVALGLPLDTTTPLIDSVIRDFNLDEFALE